MLAAIFKAMVALLLVGSRPFPMIFSPLMRLSGHNRSQETKWLSVCHLVISYPASVMTVVAVMTVDPGQVRTGHAKQPFAQVKPWFIAISFVAPSLARLYWQLGTLAAVLSLLEILLELTITLRHLLLAELIAILLLFEDKQQIGLPVAFQTLGNLLLTGLYPRISKLSQLMGIAFTCQNGLDDRLSGQSAHIAQHIGQLNVHLAHRLLHPLDVPAGTLHQIIPLPPVGSHHTNLLRWPKRISQQPVGVQLH